MNHLAQVDIGNKFGSRFGQDLTLGNLVNTLVPAAIVIAGVLLMFFIVFGGISMIAGAGSGDAQAGAKGKQAATYALIGFVVIFAAFWVIQLIQAITGQNFFTAPNL